MTHAFFAPPDTGHYVLRNVRAPRCLIDTADAGAKAGDAVADAGAKAGDAASDQAAKAADAAAKDAGA